jgi:hypothetical protein
VRLVEYTDADGYKHLSWLRDRDPDEDAPRGLPHDPPPVDSLGLDEATARDLHNRLVDGRLVTWHNSTEFKDGLNRAAGLAGLDEAGRTALYRLYTHGAPATPDLPFDLEMALDALPCTDRERECIRRTFAAAGIRDLYGVENAPTRVGHKLCGMDIYQLVALLLGKPL